MITNLLTIVTKVFLLRNSKNNHLKERSMNIKNRYPDTVELRSNAPASIENRSCTSFSLSPGIFFLFFYLETFGSNGFGSIENRG